MSLTLGTFVIVCCTFGKFSAEVSEHSDEKAKDLYFCTRDQDTGSDSDDYCTKLLKCLVHCQVKPCPSQKNIDHEELEKSSKLFDTCAKEILPDVDWPLFKRDKQIKSATSTDEHQSPEIKTILNVLSNWGEEPVCYKNVDGLYPDYKNCHRYYQCRQGVLHPMHCPPRERFNKLTKHCEPGTSHACQTKKISTKNSRKQNRAKTKASGKTAVQETNSELGNERDKHLKAVYFCNRNHNAPINDPDYCRLFHQCLVYCDKTNCPLLDNLNPEFFQYLVTSFYSPHNVSSETLPQSYHHFANITTETFYKKIEKSKLLYDSCREEILADVDWNLFAPMTWITETREIAGGTASSQAPFLQTEEGYLYFCTGKRGGLLENPENCRRVIACVKDCKKSKKCRYQRSFNFEQLEIAKDLFESCTDKVTESKEIENTLAPNTPTTSKPRKPSTTTKTTQVTTESLQSLYDKGGKHIYFCTSKHDELAATIDNCQRLFKCIVSCKNFKHCFLPKLFDPKQLTKALELYDECTILPPEQVTKQPKLTTTPTRKSSPRHEGQERAERICNRDIIIRTEDTKHCDKYFMCTDRGVELMTCPEGELFDDLRFRCAPKADVYCNGRSRP